MLIHKIQITNSTNIKTWLNDLGKVQGVLNSFNGTQITNYSAAIKGLNLNQAQLLLTTQRLDSERSKEILIEAGLLASENSIQAELLETTLIRAGLNNEERTAILNQLGLISAESTEATVQGTCTKADLEAVLAQKLKNAEDAEGIIKTLGLAGANATTTASFGLLTKSIWANIKAMAAWMISNPIGWIILGVGAVFGLVKGIDALTESTEEAADAATEAKEKYTEIESEIDSLNNKIKENKKLIEETNGNAQYDGYRKRLEAENKELERQIELERIKAQEAKSESDRKATKLLTSEKYEYDKKYDVNATGAGYTTTSQKGDIYTATDWYLKQAESTGVISDTLKDNIDIIKEQRENLDLLNPESKKLYDNLGLLIDRYVALYPNIKLTSDESSDLSDATNKINLSLDAYKKASEGISSLATAFKELTDDEYVSLETISKIKEAVGDSISNWDAYEQKLLSVKKGTAEYNQLMRELTYATLEKQLGGVNALAQADEKYVAQLLRENGVLNANEVAHNAVERAKAKELAQSNANNQESVKTVESLIQEANSAGISTNAYLELTAKEILFNNNKLDTSDKCKQILAIASAAGVASTAYSTLSSQIDAWSSKDLLGSGTRTQTATDLGMTVINEKNRGKDGKGKGNLYVASDGSEFEDYKDAMYYQESLNNVQKISDAYSNVNFVLPDYSGIETGNKKDTKETFDWIETKVKRLQRTITNFGKTVSATWESWTNRNSALKSQISAVTSEINLQQQAADKYLSLANGVSLSGTYKELVRNGSLNISTISDENTINAIKKYQEYYNAYLDCLDAKQDAQDELASLVREDFDLIAKQFDSEISLVEANISNLEAYIDQTEMKGNLVSKNYYSAMYAQEEKNLGLLRQKYEQLSNKLSNGTIAQGSEEFNNMTTEIKEVSKAIIESNTALEEYQKTMRDLDWEVFDIIEEKIGNVTEESEFLIDLLSNSKLFNDDGSTTSQGQATLGLHVANMRVYESQIKDYANEIARLDAQFANDSLDKNYLERRQELLELQHESILAMKSEEQSIRDLWSDGYSKLLDYMQEVSDKYRDMISQISDTRDFEKNIKSQVEEISRLENIWHSYQNDTSEEGRMNKQQIGEQLKEARETLEETEREQYLKDLDRMITAMLDDASEWQNARLDDVSGLIQDVVDSTDKNAETIKTTLETEVKGVGGTLTTEMQNLWSGAEGVKGVLGGVSETLNSIKEDVHSMVKDSDTEASKNASNATADAKPVTKPATTPNTSNTSNNSSNSAKTITVGGKINAGSAKIYDYAGDTSGERQYYRNDPIYTVLTERNGYLKVRHHKLSSGTTGWFKKSDVKAYKTGGLVNETGLAWLDGTKRKPELVLNPHDTENYMKLTETLRSVANTNMFDAIGNYAKLPNFVPNGNMQNTSGDVIFEHIEIVANDPQEFARQLKDVYDRNVGNVRKMINTDVHSKYGSHNYRRYL